MENAEESRLRKKAGWRNRKLKVRNTLRFSFQHSHQPLQSQCLLQQGAGRDALPKAETNWGFLWYFSFYFSPWLWYSLAKASQTLCSKPPFHRNSTKKPPILLRGNYIMKGKAWVLLAQLNFTERNFGIPWLEALEPINCHRSHSFPGDTTGNLSFEEWRV